MMRWRMMLAAVSVVGLVTAGCGDDSDDAGEPTTTAAEDAATTSPGTGDSESDEPLMTMVWDGASARYIGPDTIEAGSFDVRLVNESDGDVVDFAFGRHDPEADVTEEEVFAWSGPEQPPWVESGGHFAMRVRAGETRDERGQLFAGYRYELVVWDGWTNRAYVAALVDVVPGED